MNHPRTYLTWLAALTISLCAVTLRSQTPSEPVAQRASAASEETVQLTPFTVSASANAGYGALMGTTGRLATPYLDVPQAASILTSEFLNDAKLFGLNDAVFFVPGVRPSSTLLGGFVIRGVNGASSAFIDGMIDYSSLTRQNDTFFYDRIEIVKGPSSVAFGRGDPTGFVNQVTKKPQFQEGTEVGLLFGTGNDRKNTSRGTLDNQGFLSQDHQTAYRFLALLDDGAQSMNYYGNYRRSGAQLAISHRLSERRGQLDVVAAYQTSRIPGSLYFGTYSNKYYFSAMKYFSENVRGITVPSFPLIDGNDVPGYERAQIEQESFRLTGTMTYKLSEHWNARVAGAYTTSHQRGDLWQLGAVITAARISPTGQLSEFLFLTPLTNNRETKSTQADLVGEYDLDRIGAKLSLLTGVDGSWRKSADGPAFGIFRDSVPRTFMPILQFNPYATLPNYTRDPWEIASDLDQQDSSAYAQAQLKFLKEKVQLTAAGRRNWTTGDSTNRGTGGVTSLDSHSPFLPTYSLLVKPLQWLSVYATHAEYSTPPAVANEWIITAQDDANVPANDPIRALRVVSKPTNKQDEFGAKASLLNGKLIVSVARFKTKITGVYNFIAQNVALSNGSTLSLLHNVPNSADIEGWEIEGFGQVGQKLTYMFSAALGSKGENHSIFNSQLIDTRKPWFGDTVSGYMTYSFGPSRREGLSVTVGAKANLSGWLITANQQTIPDVPQTTYGRTEYFFDVGANYGFKGGKYEVYVKANNINHKEAMPYSDSAQIPGRQIFAGITARF